MYKIDSDIVFMFRTYTEIQVHQVFWCCCWSKLGLWAGRRLGWGGDIHEERWTSPRPLKEKANANARRSGFNYDILRELPSTLERDDWIQG